jgi:hypothetical protein
MINEFKQTNHKASRHYRPPAPTMSDNTDGTIRPGSNADDTARPGQTSALPPDPAATSYRADGSARPPGRNT